MYQGWKDDPSLSQQHRRRLREQTRRQGAREGIDAMTERLKAILPYQAFGPLEDLAEELKAGPFKQL